MPPRGAGRRDDHAVDQFVTTLLPRLPCKELGHGDRLRVQHGIVFTIVRQKPLVVLAAPEACQRDGDSQVCRLSA